MNVHLQGEMMNNLDSDYTPSELLNLERDIKNLKAVVDQMTKSYEALKNRTRQMPSLVLGSPVPDARKPSDK